MGTLVNSNLPVQLSSTILETPLYIQSDYLPACTKLIELLLTQNNIEKNVLLYDLEGTFATLNAPKYTLGENYKVPLNEFFIDFVYRLMSTGKGWMGFKWKIKKFFRNLFKHFK